jgi:hypothetical protein
MRTKINEVITALLELEAKGCHTVFFEYGDGLFNVRIYRGQAEAGDLMYEDLNMMEYDLELLLDFIDNLKKRILTTSFPCYKRQFVKGKRAGKWAKIKPVIEFGEKATTAMRIDGSGYLIDDPENRVQYFVDFNHDSNIDKQ